MKKIIVLFAMLLLAFSLSNAKNPVLVAADSTGDYVNIQDAIKSWCVGGANASETAPITINIKPGTYDEVLTLNDASTGFGNIAGNLIIQSSDSTAKPIIKLKRNPDTATSAGNYDGLWIYQSTYDVSFYNLVFCPSTTVNGGGVIDDDMLKIDENGPNAVANWISFYNCVITDINTTGNPMVLTKDDALNPPPTRGSQMGAGDLLLKSWGDTGENINVRLVNCLFYGGASYDAQLMTDGTPGEQIYIKDSMFAYGGYGNLNIAGTKAGVVTITGTKPAKDGDWKNCSFIYNPRGAFHALYFNASLASATTGGANMYKYNVSNTIVSAMDTSSFASRAISGGAYSNINISDSIMQSLTLNIVYGSFGIQSVVRCTFNTASATNFWYSVGGNRGYTPDTTLFETGKIVIRDSIISGPGTKFALANASSFWPTGGVDINNTALPTLGANSITDIMTSTDSASFILGSNIVTADPMYASFSPTSTAFYDVTNASYAGKASDGGVLVGGANFISAVYLIGPANVTLGATDTIVANNGVAPYTWQSSNTTVGTITGTGASVTFNALALGSTDVTVTDAAGGTNKITVNVIATSAPLASEMME